MEDVWLR